MTFFVSDYDRPIQTALGIGVILTASVIGEWIGDADVGFKSALLLLAFLSLVYGIAIGRNS